MNILRVVIWLLIALALCQNLMDLAAGLLLRRLG